MENTPDISPLAPPLAVYKDRSTGLVIFGIMTVLLGGLWGLLTLFMSVSLLRIRSTGTPPVSTVGILPILGSYGGLTVALIWLGTGSILKRRWARALLLIFSWSWLVMGIFMTAIMPFVMAKTMASVPPNATTGQPALPPGAITGMVIGMTLFFFVFFVLVPAIWVFFYQRRHVRATCEASDPVTRWTDACPLPVLGFSLWTWLGVPMMLLWPLTGHAVLPCFGVFVSGLPAALFCVVIAAVWGTAARWLYRLDARGWWLILVAMLVFTASALLTYARHGIVEMYQLQGLPPAQIDQMQKMGLLSSRSLGWFSVLFTLPFLGYLLFIKKYLGQKSDRLG
jgi:hypothetical protein